MAPSSPSTATIAPLPTGEKLPSRNLTNDETGLKNRTDAEIKDMFLNGKRPVQGNTDGGAANASLNPVIRIGAQILVDMHECSPAVLDDLGAIRELMLEAARRAGATVVSECFHRFSPHGVSGVVVIAESHLAIHTWPEQGFAALDLFTCGDTLQPEACFSYLREALSCRRHSTTTIARGVRRPPP